MTAKRLWGILLVIAGGVLFLPPVVMALLPIIAETWGFGGVGYPGGFVAMQRYLLMAFIGAAALVTGVWLLTERPKQ